MISQALNAKFIINETIFPKVKEWIHNFEREHNSCNLFDPSQHDSPSQKVKYLNHFFTSTSKSECHQQLYIALLESIAHLDSNLIVVPGYWSKYFSDFVEYMLLQNRETRLQQCWSLLGILGTFNISEGKVNALFGYQLSLIFDTQTNYEGFILETQFLNPFVLTHCHTLDDLTRIPIFEAFFSAPDHLLKTLLGEFFVRKHMIGVIDDEADSKFYEVVTLIKTSLDFQPQSLNTVFKSLATISILISLAETAEKQYIHSFELLDKDLVAHVAKLLVIRIDYLYSFLENENKKIAKKTGNGNISLILRVVASLLYENLFTWISSSIRNYQFNKSTQQHYRLDFVSIPTQYPHSDSKESLSLDELLLNSITDFVYKRIYEKELLIDVTTPSNQAFEFTKRISTVTEFFLMSNGGFFDAISKSSILNGQDVINAFYKNVHGMQTLRKFTVEECNQLASINQDTISIHHQFGVHKYSIQKMCEFGHFLHENVLDILLHAPGVWSTQYMKARIESLFSANDHFAVLLVAELPNSFSHDIQIVRKVVQICKDPIMNIINTVHFSLVKRDIRVVVEFLKPLLRYFKFTSTSSSLYLLLKLLHIEPTKFVTSDSIFVIDKVEFEFLKRLVSFVENRNATRIQQWYRLCKARKLTMLVSKSLMQRAIMEGMKEIDNSTDQFVIEQTISPQVEEERGGLLLEYGSAEEEEEEENIIDDEMHTIKASGLPNSITVFSHVEEVVMAQAIEEHQEEFVLKKFDDDQPQEQQQEAIQQQNLEAEPAAQTTPSKKRRNKKKTPKKSNDPDNVQQNTTPNNSNAWEEWKKQVHELSEALQKETKSKNSPKSSNTKRATNHKGRSRK